MSRFFLLLLMAAALVRSFAVAAEYDVDLADASLLDRVPSEDVAPEPSGPSFDATRVGSGDTIHLLTSSTGKSLNASRLVVAGGGTLAVGYDSAGAAGNGFLAVTLTDNGEKRDFVVGDASSAGAVNLGADGNDKQLTFSGGALGIANGVVRYARSSSAVLALSFDSMTFARGVVDMVDADTRLSIGSGGAVIGHGTDSADTAVLNVSSGAGFTGGVTLLRGGLLRGNGRDANVSFGTGGRLVLAGGGVAANGDALKLLSKTIVVQDVEDARSVLDASGGSIAFADGAAMTVSGGLDVIGADTAISLQRYAQEGGDVVLTGSAGFTVLEKGEIAGGTFRAEYATFAGGLDLTAGSRLLHGALAIGSGSLLRVRSTAALDLSEGDLTLLGGAGAELYGTLLVGADVDRAWRLALSGRGGLAIAEGASIELSEDFINRLDGTNYLGTVIVLAGERGAVTLPGGKDELAFDNFLYGQYTYVLDRDGNLLLDSYFTGVDRDGSRRDYEWAAGLLAEQYGPLLAKTDGFTRNIYRSAVREDAGPVPYDRLLPSSRALVEGSDDWHSHRMNLANLQAFARGQEAAAGGSLAGMYAGVAGSGAVDVAMATAGAVVDHVKMRVRSVNADRVDNSETICPAGALPSLILDSDRVNRIWIGGLGISEDADARGGVPGYRYMPGGFVGGYDHALDSLSLGVAYAYAKGDFSDKSSLRHDSEIGSHTFGVHGTWFDSSGLYVSAMGGYTYSDNDIAELRRDASVEEGMSWNRAEFHGHTYHAALEVGREFRLAGGLTIVPALGVTYIYSQATDHDEYLGGVLAGRVRGVKNSGAFVPARLEVGYEVAAGAESRIKLTANAGYTYNFRDDGIDGTFSLAGFSNAFDHDLAGRAPGRHSCNFGAGVRFFTDVLDIGLKYDYFGRAGYSGHRLMATFGVGF